MYGSRKSVSDQILEALCIKLLRTEHVIKVIVWNVGLCPNEVWSIVRLLKSTAYHDASIIGMVKLRSRAYALLTVTMAAWLNMEKLTNSTYFSQYSSDICFII